MPRNLEQRRQQNLESYYRDHERSKRLQRARSARYRQEARELVRSVKTQPCADCGRSYDPCVMDFHHLEPGIKLATLVSWGRVAAIQEELKKGIIVCPTCHRIRECASS